VEGRLQGTRKIPLAKVGIPLAFRRREDVKSLFLRPAQDAATAGVVPFLLYEIGIAVKGDGATEVPGALIADLVPLGVEPGCDEWISSSLHLLMRCYIDGAIGINVTVGTAGNATGGEVGSRVGHRGVDGVRSEVVVIGAERGETARTPVSRR